MPCVRHCNNNPLSLPRSTGCFFLNKRKIRCLFHETVKFPLCVAGRGKHHIPKSDTGRLMLPECTSTGLNVSWLSSNKVLSPESRTGQQRCWKYQSRLRFSHQMMFEVQHVRKDPHQATSVRGSLILVFSCFPFRCYKTQFFPDHSGRSIW